MTELNYKQLIEKQKKFFETGQTKDVDYRIARLKILKRMIKKHNSSIINALQNDLNKSETESIITEIMCIMDELNLAIKKLHLWTKSQRVKTPFAFFRASSKYYYQPYGCVLIVGAWNYPFNLTLIPAINAIAAGNCCIIKPSEVAPHSSAVVAKIIKECFDDEFCAVCEGGVDQVTVLLSQKVDFIHYTGSTSVGRIVAEAAAKQLIPVILELGGKCPCIVDQTANLEIAAKRICWGKFTNAGQTCVAPDYLFVHESIQKCFLKLMQKTLVDFYGEEPTQCPNYPRIINEKNFDRLTTLLQGNNVIFGGKADRSKLCITPTLIDLPSTGNIIMDEEIFGPVLPIISYSNLSEVIDVINNKHKNPLALYLFSTDKLTQHRILKDVSFGGGCINSTIMHTGNLHLPFGGIGNSGIGNYHGKHGFEAFSHKKGILKKSNLIDLPFQYPPFRNRVKLLKFLLIR